MGLANPDNAIFEGSLPGADVLTSPMTITVSVVACPTYRGTTGPKPPAEYPATAAIPDLGAAPFNLSEYSDSSRSLTPLLGPKGWHCEVSVGADGSIGLSVIPPGEALPEPFTSVPNKDEAVSATSPSACQSCVYDLAPPVIQAVAHTSLAHDYGRCPATAPKTQTESWVRGSPSQVSSGKAFSVAVAFADPPGTNGTNQPSGGAYPANGLALFDYSPGHGYSATSETCTVPANEHATCTAILDQFEVSGWPTSA